MTLRLGVQTIVLLAWCVPLQCFVILSESEGSEYVHQCILLCSRSQILRCPQDDRDRMNIKLVASN